MVEMGAENIPEGGEVGPEGGGWTGNIDVHPGLCKL